MKKLNCIIVDDEEGAHRVLEHFIAQSTYLNLSGSFFTAIDAMDYVYKNHIDLIFLDINMPGLSGMEMLEAMSKRPFVILTTAYKEFALESYQYDVCDYLVKPFDFKRFLSAIDKVINRMGIIKHLFSENDLENPEHIILKVDGGVVKVTFDEIRYTQSCGNYVKFFTQEKMLLSQITTQEVEKKLNDKLFIRIHKSHLVALVEISKISGGQVSLRDGTILPLGNFYKKNVIDRLA